MSEPRRHKPRVSLTKSQIQEGISAELFSLCQGITAEGRLSKDEIVALGLWLHDNRDADLPGIAFLSDTLNRIIADGRVTREGQRELMEAIERVLPPDARKTAKAARRAVEANRKADVIAARNEKRKQELESQERRWPEDEFDFMVAGINFDGRYRIIERYLNVGDRVRIVPEPDNPHDECAVAVTLTDGRKIGYVPRHDSEDVSGCIDDGGYFVATVKKILTGGRFPVPVIVLQFYRPDQLADIAELNPDPCSTATPAQPSLGCPRALGYLLALPVLPLILAVRLANGIFTLLLRLGVVILRLLATAVSWITPSLARRIGGGADVLSKLAMPVLTVAGELGSWIRKGAYSATTSVVGWLASVKDDLQGKEDREVNPVWLIAKLVVIASVSGVLIILLIKVILLAVSLRA